MPSEASDECLKNLMLAANKPMTSLPYQEGSVIAWASTS